MSLNDEDIATAVAAARRALAQLLGADVDAVSALRAAAPEQAAAAVYALAEALRPAVPSGLCHIFRGRIAAARPAFDEEPAVVAERRLFSATGAPADTRALLEFALSLAAPADALALEVVAHDVGGAPPPPSDTLTAVVLALFREGERFTGHELFPHRALRGVALPGAAQVRNEVKHPGVTKRGHEDANRGRFDSRNDKNFDGRSPSLKESPLAIRELTVRELLAPPRHALDDSALSALLNIDDFARVGVWNMHGNWAFEADEGAGGDERRSSARVKAEHLGLLIAAERWSACVLQELSRDNTLVDGFVRPLLPTLRLWRFETSQRIGRGWQSRSESAVFGFDSCAWERVLEPTVLPEDFAPAPGFMPFAFTRQPALLLLRSRVRPGAHLALISAHLDPASDTAPAEAAALTTHLLPWLTQQLTERAPHVDAARVTVAIVGDFNLPPPGRGAAYATGAWAGLIAAGFASTKADNVPTNVPDFGALGFEYDNAFVRSAPGRAAAHVVDIARDVRFSRLANDIEAVAAAVAAIRLRSSPHDLVRTFATHMEEEYRVLRSSSRDEFVLEWSDHKPLTLTLTWRGAGGDGGGGDGGGGCHDLGARTLDVEFARVAEGTVEAERM